MPVQLQPQDVRESLSNHVAARGEEIRRKYGPTIGWAELQRVLADRSCVRYPCELVFDAAALHPGECAHPVPRGDQPEEGFVLHVHPFFMTQLDQVPLLAFYQLVLVNYGQFASPEDAETFGAAVLGLTRDDYYERLCDMADQLGGSPE
jgi:hypothetical protein